MTANCCKLSGGILSLVLRAKHRTNFGKLLSFANLWFGCESAQAIDRRPFVARDNAACPAEKLIGLALKFFGNVKARRAEIAALAAWGWDRRCPLVDRPSCLACHMS